MSNKSKEVVIVSAIRTPIGAYKGSLKNIKSHHLGSIVIKEVLKRSKFDIQKTSHHPSSPTNPIQLQKVTG